MAQPFANDNAIWGFGKSDHDVQLGSGSQVDINLDEPQPGVGGHRPIQRHLRRYHVTMIGFCSGIGVGLFVGTGAAYARAGPAGLLLAYTIVGSVVWCVMQSIGELATLFPTAGTFPHWATRFIDPSVGFSLAISYAYLYAITIASECSAAAVLVSYWTDITPAVVISVSLALILAINLMNVRYFGEVEVFAGAVKIFCFIGLILISIVITSGGGPSHESIGFRYWNDPGPWVNYNGVAGSTGHFLGFLSAFVNAAFSFIGTETVVISAAESVNPHHDIPRAARYVLYRICFFYIVGTFLIGILVDPRNPGLVSGSGNANSSPWVIGIKQAGISIIPSIVNACILVSAWSAGNSYGWVGSRIIVAATIDRHLPQVFGRTSRHGVPYVAVITVWVFGLLAYLSKFERALSTYQFLYRQHLTCASASHRSWNWRRIPSLRLVAKSCYGSRTDGMGNNVSLLHPLL
jgi:amino acid transporter